jgi:hypothetical protein
MKWLGLALVLGACSHGGAGDSTGGLSSQDGGVPLLPGEKCGPEALCSGSTQKTYRRCQVDGPPCAARFITSDAQSFNCAGCNDCGAAAGLVTGWCGPGDEMCKNEATRNACITCCQNAHKPGSDYYTMLFQTCLCTTPGDCAVDCQTDYCATGMINDFFCQFCIQNTTCDPSSKCKTNSDCGSFLDCGMTCPAM